MVQMVGRAPKFNTGGKMKFVHGISLVVLLTSAFSQAIDTKGVDCNDSGFVKTAWSDLTSQEPRIQKALNDIASWTGQTFNGSVLLTNCRVVYPINETGTPLEGFRSVVIDKVWYSTINSVQSKRQAGFKILYYLKYSREPLSGGGAIIRRSRDIRGMVFCKTPEGCEAMDIPIRLPEEKPFPISYSDPIPGVIVGDPPF